MSSQQSIRDIFFEECEDLLDLLIEGLAEMMDGECDSETLNAVFRSVHSIKGGAGAFALDELVKFAHTFETLLDKLRSGQIETSLKILTTLQKSGDTLSDIVESAKNETEPNLPAVNLLLNELESHMVGFLDEAPEVEFEPIGIPLILEEDGVCEDKCQSIVIQLSPHSELYSVGHEPLALLYSLSDYGQLSVDLDHDLVPRIDVLEPNTSYVSWKIFLETTATPETICDVFEFIEGLCDLSLALNHDATTIHPEEVNYNAETQVNEPAIKKKSEKGELTNSCPSEPLKVTSNQPKRETRDTLRVDVLRIDRLINLVGELIVNQAMISQKVVNEDEALDIQSELDDYKQLARDLQEGVMSLRTQPVKPLFQRMSRIVREASESTGKKVKLEVVGEWTEVDKKVTEKLSDPLTHMIRNSIDHGIESTEDRITAGKDEVGQVTLEAFHKSGNVVINVIDDGAGLNRKKILEIATNRGLIDPGVNLTDQEIDELLFLPGFSTAKEVTSLSGRGVGMDVVRTSISELGGKISINSTPGFGTKFNIQLPLTLAVLDGMAIEIGDQTLILPISCILEAIRPKEQDIGDILSGSDILKYRDGFLKVVHLSDFFGLESRIENPLDKVILVVSSGNCLFAFSVDGIKEQRQVVIKTLEGNYGSIPGVSAATILGDGSVALILDPDGIAEQYKTKISELVE